MKKLGVLVPLLVIPALTACSAFVDPDTSDLARIDRVDSGTGTVDAGSTDAGRVDAPPADAGTDAGPPDGGPPPCEPVGATETVSCGDRCGTAERVCGSDGFWEMGACESEGACSPGETVAVTCGVTGSVDVVCTEECDVPAVVCPLDVMLLLDVTGSHRQTINNNAGAIIDNLAAPLLAIAGVRVGVAYFADFPVSPFGNMSDVPFGGQTPPTRDVTMVRAGVGSVPAMSGGDLPESGMEALHVLAGGAPHMSSRPFACGGGCWRAGAERAVVIITDVSQHNAPSSFLPPGELVSPYPAGLGAPSWYDDVRPLVEDERITIFGVVRDQGDSADDAYRQLTLLVTELGQDPDASIVGYMSGGGAADIRAPLAAVRDLIVARYGL